MVNNVIESYPDSNEVIQFKETKIQTRIRSSCTANGQQPPEDQQQKTTIRPVDKYDDCQLKSQLNAADDAIQLKRSKLTDDHALYELLHDKDLAETGSSVLSSYLAANEHHLVNESCHFLACTNAGNLENELPGNILIDEFENSIEINESADSFNENKIAICDSNPLSDSSTQTATTLQNDPFLSFLPYHFSATSGTSATGSSAGKFSQASLGLSSATGGTSQPSSNLSKILLSNQDLNKPDQFKSDLRPALNGQTTTDLFQFGGGSGHQASARSSSPSAYIKLDSQENEQIKMNQTNSSMHSCSIGQPITSASIGASIESIDPIIGEKRLLSSQKLNGEDLLFSLTSEDLNDVTSYFSLLNSELKEKSSGFNCSPSLDSVDSMFCGSSVWDSPPPSSNSSNNSSLNNDLDLPFILSSDSNDLSTSQENEQSFLDSEFPFLSEDSIFNSFVNSNLNDLINTDAFFDEKLTDDLQFENNLNSFLSCPNFGSGAFGSANDHGTLARTKQHCTLSKDSNLAKLLREKLPIKIPSQSNQTRTETNSSNSSNSLKTKENLTASTAAPANANVNSTVNTTNSTPTNSLTNAATVAGKDAAAADSKKTNGLIARKFTIQGVNINNATTESRPKTAAVSTGCLARSIKIIDPVAVQVAGSSNVKYLLNNYTATTAATAAPNGTSQTGNSFSLNISPASCLTVTTNASTSSLANSSTAGSQVSTAKSFIIKSVDGKFANGILYTPISRNGTNIAYTSTLTANGVPAVANGLSATTGSATTGSTTTSSAPESKTKIMAAFTPNSLFINNRKLVQKRPYSSMSVSIPSNSSQTTKDFYSIDLVPKPITNHLANLAADTTQFACAGDLSAELKKKVKTSLEIAGTPTASSKSHSSSKCHSEFPSSRTNEGIVAVNSVVNSSNRLSIEFSSRTNFSIFPLLQSFQRTRCCSTCW